MTMAIPYFNDPAMGWNATPADPYTAAQLPGVLSGQTSSIGHSGPLSGSGGGGFLSGLRGLLDPQYALPIAAQLIGGATPQASFAGALGAAGPAIGDIRRRGAMNAYLKAHSGLGLTPDEQQLLQNDPELGRAFVAQQLTPKPPITVGAGDRLYDPATHTWTTPPGGGGYAGTTMDAQNWNIILQGKNDTPEYAAAYNQLFQTPKMASGTGPNNEITQTPYYPDIPPGVKPPTGAAAAAGGPSGDPAVPAADGGPRVGKPIVTGQKPPTESAARAAGLYTKAKPDYDAAIKNYDALSSTGNQVLDALGKPGRFFQSENYQVARDAVKSVVGSYQYAASGASAPEEEVIRNAASVLPDISDTPAAIAAKKQRLGWMMEAMQIQANGGRIPDGLKQAIGIDVGGGEGKGGAGGGAKEGDTATGANGHKIVLKGGQWLDAETGQPVQ